MSSSIFTVEGDLHYSSDDDQSSEASTESSINNVLGTSPYNELNSDPSPHYMTACSHAHSHEEDEEEIEVFGGGDVIAKSRGGWRDGRSFATTSNGEEKDFALSQAEESFPFPPEIENEPDIHQESSSRGSAIGCKVPEAVANSSEREEEGGEFSVVEEAAGESRAASLQKTLQMIRQSAEARATVDFLQEIAQLLAEGASEASPASLSAGEDWGAASRPFSLDEPLLLGDGGQSQGALTGEDIAERHRAALRSVVEVYGSGLGDQEVRLLDSPPDPPSSSLHSSLPPRPGAPLDVIAEGEEEGEEESEGEGEDVKAAQERARESFLQKEWGEAAISDCGAQERNGGRASPPVSLTSYLEALQFLEGQDLSPFAPLIVTSEGGQDRGGLFSLFSSAPPALSFPDHQEKLRFPFLVAQLDYNPHAPPHFSLLCSIFRRLLGESEKGGLRAVDERWELIGFQGSDPRTDLNRSMKLLTLLLVLGFLDDNSTLCQQLFSLSSSHCKPAEGQGDKSWPFMCVAVMFCKEALQTLRRGGLNKYCNRKGEVLSVLLTFFEALFFDFAISLLQVPERHHALHLSTLRERCAKQPSSLLKSYEKSGRALPSTSSLPLPSVSPSAPSLPVLHAFDDLESLPPEPPLDLDRGGKVMGKAARFALT